MNHCVLCFNRAGLSLLGCAVVLWGTSNAWAAQPEIRIEVKPREGVYNRVARPEGSGGEMSPVTMTVTVSSTDGKEREVPLFLKAEDVFKEPVQWQEKLRLTLPASGYGYFQRNRDLGQVINIPPGKDIKLDAIVLRTSRGNNAVRDARSAGGTRLYSVVRGASGRRGFFAN